jgi:hypothetical protein
MNIFDSNKQNLNIDIDIVKYYIKDDDIIPIDNHEVFTIFKFFDDRNMYIHDDTIDIISIIYDNIEYFKYDLLTYNLILDRENFEPAFRMFRKIYLSFFKNGYSNTIIDPVLIYRVKKDNETVLCLAGGIIKFISCKHLGLKNISVYVSDSDPNKNYNFY